MDETPNFNNDIAQQMQQDLEIEMRIWEYLDGICSDEERVRTEAFIAQNPMWKKKHEEILLLQAGLQTNLELEHTSMRFSKNVMEAVAQTKVAPKARTYINIWVIRSIAAFFILTIGGALVALLSSVEWSSSTGSSINLPVDKISLPITSSLLYTFASLNIIAGLILLDILLKRKRTNMTT